MFMFPTFFKPLADAMMARHRAYAQHADAAAAETGVQKPGVSGFADALVPVVAEVLLNVRMALNRPDLAPLYDDVVKRACDLADKKWRARGSPKSKDKEQLS